MATTDCNVSHARLKITVPDDFSIEQYKKLTQSILLYPNHFIYKDKGNTYTLEDDAGDKIQNIDVETIVKCGEKEANLNINYLRLEGLPRNLSISEIVYYKPKTNEIYTTGILPKTT